MAETTGRNIRIDDQTWDRFGQLLPARTRGARTRTTVINEFINWYIRTPGADLPDRPPAPQKETTMRAHTTPPAAADDKCEHDKEPACRICNPILNPDK